MDCAVSFTRFCRNRSPLGSVTLQNFASANLTTRDFNQQMRTITVIGLILLALCVPMHSEEPFKFETTPGKLSKDVVPTFYAIRIVPDIEKLSFIGSETVNFEVRAPVRHLVLNALELKIDKAALDGNALPSSAITTDSRNELL